MTKFLLPLALALGAFLWGGCANLHYDVRVKAVAPQPAGPTTYRLADEPTDPAQQKNYRETARYIRRALAQAGFTEVSPPARADLQIDFAAWVAGPILRAKDQKPLPISAVQSPGFSDSSRLVIKPVLPSSTDPFPTAVSSGPSTADTRAPVAVLQTLFAKHLQIRASTVRDAAHDARQVWAVEAVCEDPLREIALFLPGLIATAASHAGQNTPGDQVIHLSETDPAVLSVERGR